MSLCSVILGGRLRGLSKLQERQGEKNAWHAEKSKPCLSTATGSGRERGLTVSYVSKINHSKLCHSSQTTCALRLVIDSEWVNGSNILV